MRYKYSRKCHGDDVILHVALPPSTPANLTMSATTSIPVSPEAAYNLPQSGLGTNNEASPVSTQPKSSMAMTTKFEEVEQQNKAMRLRGGCIPCPVCIKYF